MSLVTKGAAADASSSAGAAVGAAVAAAARRNEPLRTRVAAAALRAFFSRHFSRLSEASTAAAATLDRGVVGLDDFPRTPPNGFEAAVPRGVLLAPRALLGPRADFFPDAPEIELEREERAPLLLPSLNGFSRGSSDAE